MGKIKVYELAKELGITNAEVIENLRKFGVEVKSHLSVIESDIVKKIKTKIENDKKNGNDRSQMHIIRRNIKVINTDGDKEEIEEITTNISGGITKSHQTSGVESKKENNEISSGNSNKPFERRPVKPNKSRFGTRPTNVVITRNGKPIDTQPSKETKKEDKKQVSVVENKAVNEKEEKPTKDLNKETEKKVNNEIINDVRKEENKDMERKNNNIDTRSNAKDKPNFANNTQTNNKKEYSNRQNYDIDNIINKITVITDQIIIITTVITTDQVISKIMMQKSLSVITKIKWVIKVTKNLIGQIKIAVAITEIITVDIVIIHIVIMDIIIAGTTKTIPHIKLINL